jgi:hypothetical protein
LVERSNRLCFRKSRLKVKEELPGVGLPPGLPVPYHNPVTIGINLQSRQRAILRQLALQRTEDAPNPGDRNASVTKTFGGLKQEDILKRKF